ncbi:MAG TPA: Mur ligase family protein [Desulfomonilia bacterium]
MALENIDQNRWIPGLERVRKALDILGHPEKSYRHVLVGGTNGKGSVCVYLERLLSEAGLRTGVTMSPHISSYTERFRINGRDSTEKEISDTEKEIAPLLDGIGLTYFEMTVVLAARLFQKAEVDVGIFEIGLGGRLDAANVLDPALSVITNISLDHTDYLGSSISEIAAEKAAIARSGRPLVTSAAEGLDVIKDYVEKIGSQLIVVHKPVGFKPGIEGSCQPLNAALAIRAFNELGFELDADSMKSAISSAWLPGRIEHAGKVILDVAHNSASMLCLSEYLRKRKFSGIGVLGILKDKDYAAMTKMLSSVCSKVNIAPLDSPRSWGEQEIGQVAGTGNVYVFTSMTDAFNEAFEMSEEIVVTGSFYTVGEIREYLICKGWLIYGRS